MIENDDRLWLQLFELLFRMTRSFHRKRLLTNCVVVSLQRKVRLIQIRGETILASLPIKQIIWGGLDEDKVKTLSSRLFLRL